MSVCNLDPFNLAIIQSLCQEYKWRFNSSKTQISNGTLSIICKGKVWEISNSFQVRERLCCKYPCPYYELECRIKHKLSDKNSYAAAMKALHDYIGDGDYVEDIVPTYILKHKTNLDKNFKTIPLRFTDLKEAKKHFRQIKNYYEEKDKKIFTLFCKNRACIILIENYNNQLRLVKILNSFVDRKGIDRLTGYISKIIKK